MDGRWLLPLPLIGVGWWLFGFWPGGWLLVPMFPQMPITWGMLIVLGTGVIGLGGLLVWWRENL